MLARDFALARLDRVHSALSLRGLLDVFDDVATDLGVYGFILTESSEDRSGLSADRLDEPSGDSLHFIDERHVASCPRNHRVAIGDSGPIGPSWICIDLKAKPATPNGLLVRSAAAGTALQGQTIPTRTPLGRRGTVSFLPTGRDADGENLLWVVMLALALHARVEWLRDHRDGANAMLSAREREILTWLAKGKSAADVAVILNISMATVMFHYRNTAQKFGTLTRAHTVAEAFRRGVFSLSALSVANMLSEVLIDSGLI